MTCAFGNGHGCYCGCKYYDPNSEYIKYNNADPSIPTYITSTVDEIIKLNEEKIIQDIRKKYHIRSDAILGRDFRFAVIRELSRRYYKETIKIDNFEAENSYDIRNYMVDGNQE
jgi:hypothetical protein